MLLKVNGLSLGLVRINKSCIEIKTNVYFAFGDNASGYNIIKKIKAGKNTNNQCHLHAKETCCSHRS
jgi:hypothetical protein